MHTLTRIKKLNDQFARIPDVPEEEPEINRALGAMRDCGIQPGSRGSVGEQSTQLRKAQAMKFQGYINTKTNILLGNTTDGEWVDVPFVVWVYLKITGYMTRIKRRKL